jgi:hypothetical protein
VAGRAVLITARRPLPAEDPIRLAPLPADDSVRMLTSANRGWSTARGPGTRKTNKLAVFTIVTGVTPCCRVRNTFVFPL